MKDKYIVVEVEKSEFMPVTQAQNKLNFRTRPIGFYNYLTKEMKLIADSICNIQDFQNPYLLQIL
jgi:hypothetical protein